MAKKWNVRIGVLVLSFGFGPVCQAQLVRGGEVEASAVPGTERLRDGDLIFQKSQSSQSEALREATESDWTHVGILFSDRGQWFVFEARNGVSSTPLTKFIGRGRDGAFIVKRTKSPFNVVALRKEATRLQGLPYDIYFEWSDRAIYCSELVWKVFHRSNGIEIGETQKFRDLKLDGPAVRRLMDERLTKTGRELDLDEQVITPIGQMESPQLEIVITSPTP